jgi:phage shock protein PspC (stress-responsive transcriptional regulator)
MAPRRREAHDASMDTTMTPPPEPSPSQPSAAQPGPPSLAPHPLTRSHSDRMLAGVAGGIARKYGFDPAFVRVAFVAITILSFGAGVVAYLVAWLVVPEADADEPVLTAAVRHASRRPIDRRLWIGALLVLAGANALADQYGFRFPSVSHLFWPMALIGGGAALLLLRDRHEPRLGPGSDPTVAPPAPAASPDPGAPDAPGAATPDGSPPPPPSAYPPSLPWPEPPRPPVARVSRRRERSMLGRFTWSALLIVAGVAWLIDLTGAVGVDARFVLAIELAIVGIALLVGAWFGRARSLIALGLVLTLFAGTFAALDVPLRGDIGEQVVRPSAIGELDSRYRLAIGHLELDLNGTALDGRAHRVVLTDAIGFIEVFVPANARVEVKARSDLGSVDILGRPQVGGTHAHTDVVDDPPGTSGPRIVIDAHVGIGAVKVARSERISR